CWTPSASSQSRSASRPCTVVLNSARCSVSSPPSQTRTHPVTLALCTSSAPGRSTILSTSQLPSIDRRSLRRPRGLLITPGCCSACSWQQSGVPAKPHAGLLYGLTSTKQELLPATQQRLQTGTLSMNIKQA